MQEEAKKCASVVATKSGVWQVSEEALPTTTVRI
jgi:hypothetical protein